MNTDEVKQQYPKLKKIDEYAKSMGLTIYNIEYGFTADNKPIIHKIHDFNFTPERAKQNLNTKCFAELI